MKTSEIRDYMNDFCKVLNMTNERHTFEFEEDISNMRIVRHIGKFRGEVCSVLKDAQGIYFVNVNDYIKCSNIYLIEFIGNVRNYAETSLDERKDERRWLTRHELVRDSVPLKPLTIGEIKEYLNSEYGHSDEAPEFVQDYGMLVNVDKLRPEQYLWLVKKGYVWSL